MVFWIIDKLKACMAGSNESIKKNHESNLLYLLQLAKARKIKVYAVKNDREYAVIRKTNKQH